MKLLLQVMFAQGYLWRDRSPEMPDRSPEQSRASWIDLGLGLVLVWVGAISLRGAPLAGTALTTAGAGLFLAYSGSLTSALHLGRPVSTSLSWAGASLFTMLIPAEVVAAGIEGAWRLLVYGVVIAATMGAHTLRAIEERYLVFADPIKNDWRLDPRRSDPFFQRYMATFVSLPREVVEEMLAGRRR